MTDKKTDAMPGGGAAASGPAPRTPAGKGSGPAQDTRPQRRVGSMTMGLCLIAVGICFLCYYFLPAFNWLLVVKIGAPLALIVLGAEILWCAAHRDRWKYDFLAVFSCLLLMGGAFCLTLLPLFWQQVNPARRLQLDTLSEEYEDSLYEVLEDTVRLERLEAYIDSKYGVDPPHTLADADKASVRFWLEVELYGPYKSKEAFAADCIRVMEAVKAGEVLPDRIDFTWLQADGKVSMDLILDSPAKMNWTEAQMAERTHVWAEETYTPEEDESLDRENADDSGVTKAAPSSGERVQPSDQVAPAGENTRYPDEAMVETAS